MRPPGGIGPVNAVLDPPVKIGLRACSNYHRLIDVAFVCTGNICRSPMAEVLLRARLAERAPAVTVGSAGLLFDGRSADASARQAVAKRDLELDSFRSRRISADLFAGTALILGMERRHVREVAVLAPDLFARSFTLPEFARLAGGAPRSPDQDLRSWAESLGAQREPVDYLRAEPDDEVADPIGRSGRTFRACATQLDALLATVVDHAWPPAPADSPLTPVTHGGIHADRDRR